MAEIGLIGLGAMGRNLALNLAGQGRTVAVYDPFDEVRQAYRPEHPGIAACDSLGELVAALAPPRAVLLMVKAGPPVDAELNRLAPLLAPGDTVIDGGNSHYLDMARRGERLGLAGLHFLGVGISGGAEGARLGASVMAGGAPAGYDRAAPLLDAIAAEVDGERCLAYLGPGGAGHFVKTVHNGIEYAVMQLIAETYALMQGPLGMAHPAMQAVFSDWNKGPRASYLLEITADILGRADPATGAPVLDMIRDRAAQKGTGQWAAEAALALGVAAPTLMEAVAARALSARPRRGDGAPAAFAGDAAALLGALGEALFAATIVAYGQGFALIAAAAAEYGWDIRAGVVARIWRGGCILRAALLDDIAAAFAAEPAPAELLDDPALAETLARAAPAWREVVAAAVGHGVAVPALASALAYWDGRRAARLPANLIQAQRDYFGAHGFERTDRPGTSHLDDGEP